MGQSVHVYPLNIFNFVTSFFLDSIALSIYTLQKIKVPIPGYISYLVAIVAVNQAVFEQ